MAIYFCILVCLVFLFTFRMKIMHQKKEIIVKLRKQLNKKKRIKWKIKWINWKKTYSRYSTNGKVKRENSLRWLAYWAALRRLYLRRMWLRVLIVDALVVLLCPKISSIVFANCMPVVFHAVPSSLSPLFLEGDLINNMNNEHAIPIKSLNFNEYVYYRWLCDSP